MGDGTNGLMQILRGNGDGTFQAPNRYLVPPPSRGGIMILAGDWNADAKPDIAFVEGGAGAPTIDVLTNTTGGVPPPTRNANTTSRRGSLSLNPTTVTGGNSSTGTVTLTAVGQASTTVAITSNNAAAIVPASVTVPAGSQFAHFQRHTTQVQATTSAVITASLNGTSRSATLTINPAARRRRHCFDHASRIRHRQPQTTR